MKRLIAVPGIIALALALAPSAWASTIGPGGSAPPDSLVQGAFTMVASTGILTWTETGGRATGTAVSEVNSDPNNVFCPGCLDFLYAVGNDSTSLDSIGRVTASLFGGYMTDVGITPSRACFASQGTFPGNNPMTVDKSLDGNTVGFNWVSSAALDPGYCGPVLIIETNATQYTTGNLSIIDSGVATVTSYAPTGPVTPEPATLTLFATFLAGAGLLRRKRRS